MLVKPTGWPYHQSTLYTKLDFNGSLTRYAGGGDQWPVSEDSGGGLMFVGADDNGWAGPGQTGSATKTATRLIRVLGTPPGGLTGTNLDGRLLTDVDIKPQAVICFGTSNVALFYSYVKNEPDNLKGRTFVGMSTNNGADVTWNGAVGDEIFYTDSGDSVMAWGGLQLGAGNATGTSGIDDDYVYLYLGPVRQQSVAGYASRSGNKVIYLARCKVKGTGGASGNLLDRSKYSLFQGMSGGVPSWTADGGTTKVAVFADSNGMAHGFNVFWHSAIAKFVAVYVHAGIGSSGTQGIAVAISDSPWDPSGWTMIGYGEDLDHSYSDEVDWYLAAQAPGRWNNGTTMHFALSTYHEGVSNPNNHWDNLIVTPVTLTLIDDGEPPDSISYDSFTYTVADDWGQRTAQVAVTINGGSGGPVFVTAEDDSASTLPGVEVTIPVLSNDTASPSLLPLQVQQGSVTTPSPSGWAGITADDQILYVPATGASGIQASFQYTAKPSTAAAPTASATVRVTVQSSAPPPSGSPIRRVPQNKLVLLATEYSIGGQVAPLAAIRNKIYQGVYIAGGTMVKLLRPGATVEVGNLLDHSPAGSVDHARYWIKFMRARIAARTNIQNFMWWDFEDLSSIDPPEYHTNIPSTVVGWSQSHDKSAWIASYSWDGVPNITWSNEAKRWQTACAQACHTFAAQQNLTNFEIGHYNMPSRGGGYSQQATQVGPMFTGNNPLLSYGGHEQYFGGMGTRTKQQLINLAVSEIQGIRSAFGPNHKIIPAIWPRYAGPAIPSSYPGGSYMLPLNWFGEICNEMLAAGANGFHLWNPTDPNGLTTAHQVRWQEFMDKVYTPRANDFVRPS